MQGLLAKPVPLVLAAAYTVVVPSTQLPGDGVTVSQGPEWLVGVVAGIWLVVWLLDKLGKLPTTNGRRNMRFSGEDREAIRQSLEGVRMLREHLHTEAARTSQLHQLFTGRADDGVERWLRHHQVTNETKVILERLLTMTEEVRALRMDEQRKTGMLISSLETQQRSLTKIQSQLDGIIKDKRA